MQIDMKREEVVSLTEATKLVPPLNGRRPSLATVWRWCRKGLNGVRLEYVRVGRNLATSREALDLFYAGGRREGGVGSLVWRAAFSHHRMAAARSAKSTGF